jgi:glutamine synthetase
VRQHLAQRPHLLVGGNGAHRTIADGEPFVVGVLAELPALTAVGAPSAATDLRLQPSHWDLRTGQARAPGGDTRTAKPRPLHHRRMS